MNRKTIAVVMAFLLGAAGCGAGKYSDVKSHIDWINDYLYTYIEKLEKAERGEEVAEAMNQYGDNMLRFSRGMKKFADKYPELRKEIVPEELQEHYKKLDETIKIMQTKIEGPLRRFSLDPAVLKAQKQMTEKMLKYSQSVMGSNK